MHFLQMLKCSYKLNFVLSRISLARCAVADFEVLLCDLQHLETSGSSILPCLTRSKAISNVSLSTASAVMHCNISLISSISLFASCCENSVMRSR